MKLEGRVALVTGSGRGIGRAIALALAREGADLVVNDIDGSTAAAVAEEVRVLGRKALPIVADVTNSAQVNAMVKEAVGSLCQIDILVNNAGTTVVKAFMDSDESDWERLLRLNLTAVMICCKAALSEMIPRRSGRIVNISSDAGRIGAGRQAIYATAKAGVIAFTKSLAQEMARHQITVNTVAPGTVDTDLHRNVSAGNPNLSEAMLKRIPMRRIGRPEDIANAVLFLVTDDAEYITGQTISVNGGMSMI